MTTDLKVFCIDCRETIIDSGGNAYLKNLIEVIREISEKEINIKKENIRKFLKKSKFNKGFEKEILNLYRVERIKRLLKCIKKNHDLEFEYI